MDNIKINRNNIVDGVKELDIRLFEEYQDYIFIVFNKPINHTIQVGQELVFRRNIMQQSGSYKNLHDAVTITEIGKYLDTNGIEYDAIKTTRLPEISLEIQPITSVTFTFWDLVDNAYVSSRTETVPMVEYKFIERDDLGEYDEMEEEFKPEHLYTTESEESNYKHIYFSEYLLAIPPEYDYYDSPYMSGYTPGSDVGSYIAAHPDEFPYYSGMTAGEDPYDYVLAHPEIFDLNQITEYFLVRFKSEPKIYWQDLYLCDNNSFLSDYYVEVQDIDRKVLGILSGLKIPHKKSYLPVESNEMYEDHIEETCGIFDENGYPYDVTVHNYFFLPEDASITSLLVTCGNTSYVTQSLFESEHQYNTRQIKYLLENGVYFIPKYNPYYFYSINDEGNKNCVLWGDVLWDELKLGNNYYPRKDIWSQSGISRAFLTKNESYYNISVSKMSNEDMSVGSEWDLQLFVNDEIDKTIPEVIDLEKVKYIPVAYNEENESYKFIDKIVYNFHFRKRKEVSGNTEPYPVYDDGWFIDSDSGSTVWWNEMDYNGISFSSGAMETFVGEQSGKSDMLGYLGFTDEDIVNHKNKLKQSFIRFSFFTSKDPIEQKLLYYSTVFLDTTNLLGKYLKQITMFDSEGRNVNIPLVFYQDLSDKNLRLDSHIELTNEYDTTKSSEGFNLYLFKQDALEIPERTIYMKVEFNHAGNGKTIPLIAWPKNDDGKYVGLKLHSLVENMYIPVSLKYVEGKYTYEIQWQTVNDDGVEITLFEPKLDAEYLDSIGRADIWYNPSDYIDNNHTNQ